ncbi:hypothetical protein GGF50DRAFT_86894 [Schizophyllum commune]
MADPYKNPPSSPPTRPPRFVELNPLRTLEPGCAGLITDKEHFNLIGQDDVKRFLKRSLTEAKWAIKASDKTPIPASCDVRAYIRNEAAAIALVRAHTNAPVPNVICLFDDGGRTYIIEDVVPGALPKVSEKIVFEAEVPYELVLFHNDLARHNVIVDSETLKVNTILDSPKFDTS